MPQQSFRLGAALVKVSQVVAHGDVDSKILKSKTKWMISEMEILGNGDKCVLTTLEISEMEILIPRFP